MGLKHDKIIEYIKNLENGSKISIRKIAKELNVSIGTAHRAVRDAEVSDYVKIIPKIGILITKKVEKKSIEQLTYSEVISIVNGTLLAGQSGINKELTKFIIGAMTIDAMEKYLAPGALLIVGNRDEAQLLALNRGCAVLITGGFDCIDSHKLIGNEKGLPIISSQHDTFTVATMINNAIIQRMAQKEIIFVEDIMAAEPYCISLTDSFERILDLFSIAEMSILPVVDGQNNYLGIVSYKELLASGCKSFEKSLIKKHISAGRKTTAAYAAHLIVSDDLDFLPIVENKKLIGIVSNQDISKAMQQMYNQPCIGVSLEDVLLTGFNAQYGEDSLVLSGKVTLPMLSKIGTASWATIGMLILMAGVDAVKKQKQIDLTVDNITLHFIRPVQLNDKVEVKAEIIEKSRKCNVVEITGYHEKKIIAKALFSAKIISK